MSSGFTDYGDYIGVAYSRPLMRVAALPLILPYLDSARVRADVLARVDALVFGVGRDIEPHRYGARSHPSMTARSAVRDEFELALIRDALDRGVPVLGICRGAQLLNVALGGTLYRDRSEYPPAARSHPGGDWDRWDLVCAAALGRAEAPIHPAHPINIAPDSLLAQALGTKAIVNSYHHQAMRSLGRGARPVAWAPDGHRRSHRGEVRSSTMHRRPVGAAGILEIGRTLPQHLPNPAQPQLTARRLTSPIPRY